MSNFKDFFNITNLLKTAIILYALIFLAYFIKDCLAHKEDFKRKDRKVITLLMIGCITNFLDTLGIGSFATTQASFKFTKSSPDDIMPGTLNVGDCIPVISEFVLFLGLIQVDSVTLVAMIAAAIAGALVGARIVSSWPIKTVRIALGTALLFMAFSMACRLMEIGPFGSVGTATGLYGFKLVIAVCVNFILGALMTIGAGLYTPCIALCSALGLNVKIAFPVMFGSCSFLMPSCGFEFIKNGRYDRLAAACLTGGGVAGVALAFFIVKSLPLTVLTWLIIVVMLITAVTFYKDALKKEA